MGVVEEFAYFHKKEKKGKIIIINWDFIAWDKETKDQKKGVWFKTAPMLSLYRAKRQFGFGLHNQIHSHSL